MPSFSALISAAKVTIAPSISSTALAESAMDCSSAFCLSSYSSSCASQYCFFDSSPDCSAFKFRIISSIMVMTLPKPGALPCRASAMRSSSGLLCILAAAWISARARAFCEATVTCTCMKLALEPGSVFLKRSRASSSLRTLMVSERATNSSARVILMASHSPDLVLQLVSSSARKVSSTARASLVSSMSFANSATSMPSRPMRSISTSICPCRVATSFFFAAIRASKFVVAAVSESVESARSFDISSPIVFKMPVISPLAGA
mmetsp:Transcript_99490/g.319253  ORF Transcript_99490/g.319253 Transcript_99490/m.319253 type:complete len:263 (+) Transcript_99490:916-1704(+)